MVISSLYNRYLDYRICTYLDYSIGILIIVYLLKQLLRNISFECYQPSTVRAAWAPSSRGIYMGSYIYQVYFYLDVNHVAPCRSTPWHCKSDTNLYLPPPAITYMVYSGRCNSCCHRRLKCRTHEQKHL